jgi:hypothetical protein
VEAHIERLRLGVLVRWESAGRVLPNVEPLAGMIRNAVADERLEA